MKNYNLHHICVTAEHLYSCVKHVVWINANPEIFPVPSSELSHVLYFVFTVNFHLFQCCVEFENILSNKTCRSSEFKLFAVSAWHDWMLTNAPSLFLYIYLCYFSLSDFEEVTVQCNMFLFHTWEINRILPKRGSPTHIPLHTPFIDYRNTPIDNKFGWIIKFACSFPSCYLVCLNVIFNVIFHIWTV
jgi:hypothetical protein